MLRAARSVRQARYLLLLGVCLLIISGFPARPADAAVITQPIDNSLAEFTRGTFQRSSLSSLRANPAGVDQAGAVQLAPIGVLKDWFDSPFLLPEKLTDIGAVALGNRLFVIGGLVGSARTAHVWSTEVDQTTGAPLSEWQAEPNLPAVQTSNQTAPNLTAKVAARSLASVAAVQTDAVSNSGYIYVIGGSVNPTGGSFVNSSYAVTIGTVSNGRITSWAASSDTDTRLRIPVNQDPSFQNGVQAAPAVTFTTGGNTYVYLLGGLMRYYEGVQAVEVGSNRVFRAKVNTSNGMLVKSNGTPGWDRLADIPLPTDEGLSNVAGLWDGTAVANHFDDLGGLGGDVLYLMGGQFQSSVGNDGVTDTYNAHVFRALINSSSGALTWTSAAGPNQWQGTLPEARVGMGAVEFRGTLYLTGGRPVSGTPGQPQPAVLTSYVEDDLKLAQIGDLGSNFIINDNVLQGKPRTRHGTVVVPATPSVESPNAAFVYVIAGQGAGPPDPDPSDDQGSNTLIYGKIGTSEDTTQNGFASSGWYYSTPHDMNSTSAQVQKIEWATTITGTRPMDIQVQFRTSTASNCFDPGAFSTANWSAALDGSGTDQYFSKAGANQLNSVTQSTPPSHCFQYRVKLVNTSAGGRGTPSLLNVRIEVVVPGFPDLKVQTLQRATFGGALTGLTVQILNKNTVEDTLPANIEGGGSFFVDLFIFGPGQTPVTPTLPLELHPSNPPSSACVAIPKINMPKDQLLSIVDWYDPADVTCGIQRKPILPLITPAGHYVVIAAVDSTCGSSPYACVREGSAGGEANNLKRLEFDVAPGEVVHVLQLPIVRRVP